MNFKKDLITKPIPSQIDKDILKFLQYYYDNIGKLSIAYSSNCSSLGYISLIKMNASPATEIQASYNGKMEIDLLDNLKHSQKYTLSIQGSRSYPSFFHIKSINHIPPADKYCRRIYINCDSGHIAQLAETLLNYNRHHNFHIKFNSNINNTRNPRGEKIVIYCDEYDVEYICDLINYTKDKHPYLFKESYNTLPFLQKLNNVASISKEPMSDMYISLSGQQTQIVKSTNSFLSTILRDSYNETVKEIARTDPKLAIFYNGEYNEIIGIKYFPYINQRYHDYLINSMKTKMKILSKENDLYIDGLSPQTQSILPVHESNIQR